MPAQHWDTDAIEEILSGRAKLAGSSVWAAAQPDPRPVISFAGGLPDIPSLPAEALLRAARTVTERERKEALEYGGTFGPWPLRQAIAERSTRIEGIPVGTEHVIVSSGAAHGIGMVCETLIDPGDAVLAESPNFPGSLRTIRSFGAEVVPVALDDDGMRVDLAAKALRRLADEGRQAKLVYTIPTHQNPAGTTMTLARRERLVELAREFRTVILEDDAYGELWFETPPPPSCFALSKGEWAIKASSFSKSIATGLRMGWCMGPPALINRMSAVRFDMGSSPYLGRIIAEMIRSGDLDRHVEHLRGVYRRKLQRTTEAIARHCGDRCSYRLPAGGFFLWIELPPHVPAREVAQAANERGVVVGQGAQFFAGDQPTNHLRLSFSYVASEDIEEGIMRLAEAMDAVGGRSQAADHRRAGGRTAATGP